MSSYMAGVGPLTQLAAFGPQDAFYPSAQYPMSSWLRYTRFALNVSELAFPTGLDFGASARLLIPPSIDDMLCDVFLELTLPAVGAGWMWPRNVGYKLIKSYKLTLGDLCAVSVDGTCQLVLDGLHTPNTNSLAKLVGQGGLDAGTEHNLVVPLRVLCNPSEKCKLPLIAMTTCRTQVDITLHNASDLLQSTSEQALPPVINLVSSHLLINTATLETAERFALIGSPYTMVTENVLYQDFPVTLITNNHDIIPLPQMSVDLSFMRRSVKQIVFAFLTDTDDIVQDMLTGCTLFVNNQQQFAVRTGAYWSFPSAYRSCMACPNRSVYSINFAVVTASSLQPNGCLDMSQVSSCSLALTIDTTAVTATRLRVFSLEVRPLKFESNSITDA